MGNLLKAPIISYPIWGVGRGRSCTFFKDKYNFSVLQNLFTNILKIQVNLNMTDSMGPGKLVCHMQNPSYTYDKYLLCIGLGPSITSVICKNLSYSGPSYPSSPVLSLFSVDSQVLGDLLHFIVHNLLLHAIQIYLTFLKVLVAIILHGFTVDYFCMDGLQPISVSQRCCSPSPQRRVYTKQ